MAVSGISPTQALFLQQELDKNLAARRQLLLDPAISGFSQRDLASALNFAFGSDPLSTLGGVGVENLGLVGLPGISRDPATTNLFSQGDSLFQLGAALGGPNSLAVELQRKANTAVFQQAQQEFTSLVGKYQEIEQTIILKDSLGLPITQDDIILLQQVEALAFQKEQELAMFQQGFGGFSAPPVMQAGFGFGGGFGAPVGFGGNAIDPFQSGGFGFGGGFGASVGFGASAIDPLQSLLGGSVSGGFGGQMPGFGQAQQFPTQLLFPFFG